jgi:acetyl-CoA C-acetyltransferase
MDSIVVVGAARTAIGHFLGGLKSVPAVELGTIAGKAALERAGLKPEQVDQVIAGMVYKEGCKGNPARQIQLNLGIPIEAPAATIEQQCASGMRAMEIVLQQILLEKSEIGLAVGTESMSNVPHLIMNSREGFRLGPVKMEDALLYDALLDAFNGYHMGVTAENLAVQYNISREEQDELALLSHQRAIAAIGAGKFKEEIVPVEVKTKKGAACFDTDEHPSAKTTLEALSKLKPAFKKEGTVTAGNASGINDAAGSMVLMKESKATELGIKPLARIKATAAFGVDPSIMGIGPAYAIPKLLKETGLAYQDISYYEINEAFAAQFLAVNRILKLNMDQVNANGSGIALGHPVGCTGIRIVMATIFELRRRGGQYGIASMCVGGGPAMATLVEMI